MDASVKRVGQIDVEVAAHGRDHPEVLANVADDAKVRGVEVAPHQRLAVEQARSNRQGHVRTAVGGAHALCFQHVEHVADLEADVLTAEHPWRVPEPE